MTGKRGYFSYHATIKRLLREGRLVGYYFAGEYHGISPALVLLFDDAIHPVMPVREYRWQDYLPQLPLEAEIHRNE